MPVDSWAQNDSNNQLSRIISEAEVNMQKGLHDRAFALFTQAYQLNHTLDESYRSRKVLNSIATAYYTTGRMDQAERYFVELVEADRRHARELELSISLFNLAHVYADQQQLLRSAQLFQESLSLSLANDDATGALFTLKALGVNSQAQGDFAQAKNYQLEALEGFEQLNNDRQMALVLRNLADAEVGLKQYDQAILHYHEALPVLAAFDLHDALLHAYFGLSEAYAHLFDYEHAYLAQGAYTELLDERIQQLRQESTNRLQVEFETQRFANENIQLENLSEALQQKLYWQYGFLGLFAFVIVLAIAVLRQSRRHGKDMEKLATTDELTGLLNRRAIMKFASTEWQRSKRFTGPLSCLMFDIDHFKGINDTYGHSVGDQVLRDVSSALSSTLRQTDALGRFGGEEFLLIATQTELAQVEVVAERMRQKIEALVHKDLGGKKVTVSIGLAQLDSEASLEDLIKHADDALYQSKDNGRNQITVFSMG